MDAQRISEAASTIKKTDRALDWLKNVTNYNSSAIGVSTQGNITHMDGHSEVTPYLNAAMSEFREQIVTRAREIAQKDKADAEAAIRQEASS